MRSTSWPGPTADATCLITAFRERVAWFLKFGRIANYTMRCEQAVLMCSCACTLSQTGLLIDCTNLDPFALWCVEMRCQHGFCDLIQALLSCLAHQCHWGQPLDEATPALLWIRGSIFTDLVHETHWLYRGRRLEENDFAIVRRMARVLTYVLKGKTYRSQYLILHV